MRLPRGEVERQLARYLELAAADRRHLPDLDSRRADVIAAGCREAGIGTNLALSAQDFEPRVLSKCRAL